MEVGPGNCEQPVCRRAIPLAWPTVVVAAVCGLFPGVALAADAAAKARSGFGALLAGEHAFWQAVAFYVFGGLAVVSAIGICVSRDVVRMAVWLFATLSSVALLYFLLAAPLLGAIQLIVYVGGTLVLLIFGVMLTSKSPWARFQVKRWELAVAGVVCIVLATALIGMLFGAEWPGGPGSEDMPVATVGQHLLTTYLVPFEAASVLLLVVMIGAAYLARQEK